MAPSTAAVFISQAQSKKTLAREVITDMVASGTYTRPIVTEILPLMNYWPAEEYHQDFFERNPHQGYCMAVAAPKVAKFRKTFARLQKALTGWSRQGFRFGFLGRWFDGRGCLLGIAGFAGVSSDSVRRRASIITRSGSAPNVPIKNSMISERGLARVGSIIITAAETASAVSRLDWSGNSCSKAFSASIGATAVILACVLRRPIQSV